ncbi:hypothetical protein FQN60_017331 [Etheostoma spectabile]|uniref:Uncharacterized protein n=1 Tax=Etheostoma spectabile TaxID=54343 RepID=A0A5J5DF81_9PERO|nr:hypothetical protein FQN60_017331 [Etheostoma spectabile]
MLQNCQWYYSVSVMRCDITSFYAWRFLFPELCYAIWNTDQEARWPSDRLWCNSEAMTEDMLRPEESLNPLNTDQVYTDPSTQSHQHMNTATTARRGGVRSPALHSFMLLRSHGGAATEEEPAAGAQRVHSGVSNQEGTTNVTCLPCKAISLWRQSGAVFRSGS